MLLYIKYLLNLYLAFTSDLANAFNSNIPRSTRGSSNSSIKHKPTLGINSIEISSGGANQSSNKRSGSASTKASISTKAKESKNDSKNKSKPSNFNNPSQNNLYNVNRSSEVKKDDYKTVIKLESNKIQYASYITNK